MGSVDDVSAMLISMHDKENRENRHTHSQGHGRSAASTSLKAGHLGVKPRKKVSCQGV